MTLRLISMLLCLAGAASAQGVSCQISPAQALPGQTINILYSVPTTMPQATFLTGCKILSIRSGMPNGPAVFSPMACPFILLFIPPGTTLQTTWNQLDNSGTQVPAGKYWLEVGYNSTAGSGIREWFCFEILGANPSPSLTRQNPLKVGALTNFTINAPGHASEFYICLPSLTSNNPFMIGNELSCLDNDGVLMAAFPTNTAPGIFLAFAGFLDGAGVSPFPAINMPNTPSIAFFPFHLQAVLVDLVNFQTTLTNGLNMIIRP